MADREQLAERIRVVFGEREGVSERRTVGGGIGFMVDGNLCIAATDRGLTVRVGADARAAALDEPDVTPLFVGSRQPKAFVVVAHAGVAHDDELRSWIDRALAFVATLPPAAD